MDSLETILTAILPTFLMLMEKFPIIASIIILMGSARVVMKPIMTTLEAIASVTKTERDNEWLAKLKENKIYKAVVFVLDWFTSVKLPKK